MFDSMARWIFDPTGLTPHGFCLSWEPGLLWLHAVSDVAVGLAYLAIPFALVAIIRLRRDLVFRPVFGLFAALIVLCGIGHWLNVLTLWVPAYGVEGLVKATTAAVAIMTAIAVWKLMPRLVALPAPAELREVSAGLHEVRQTELRMAAVAREATRACDALALQLSRRESVEKQTVENEERLRVVLQSNVADALYLLDADGNIKTWNAGAERIIGYAPEEIIGQNFSVFFTPEDLATSEPAKVLATARDNGRFTTEGFRVRKDGGRFRARVTIDAIRRQDGTLRGFVKVTRDISGEHIEEAQRAIIIEAAPNGMMIVDEAGIITLANSQTEHIFGYQHGELVGQPVEILVPDSFRAAHGQMRSKFTGGQDVRGMTAGREFAGRRRDGSAVLIEILLSPVATPVGRIVVASLFDITEKSRRAAEKKDAEMHERQAAANANANLELLSQHLAKARDKAEQANQAKSRFLASVTHELRTPLHGILGYAELLGLEGGLNSTQTERLEVMMASGQHLLGMINTVLDMSQIEANQVDLQPEEIDLQALIRVCLDVIRPAAEAKGLTLGPAPTVAVHLFADPTRLRQVLINMLGNAVKFTPAGAVEVRLRPTGAGAICIEVVDTGPGIRAMHHDKLFQTFERLNAQAVSGIEGSGLGLAIAARLVQLMGGRIGYADNPCGGSVFWLELPLAVADASGAIHVAASKGQVATRHLRVLVADDEALNRRIAERFLNIAGHEVVCVENGAAALEAAAAGDYDVILMDVRMPVMNGLEATRRIRELPAPRGQIPVVAVTAQAFAQQIEMCHEAGMDGHVTKPFKQSVLLATLENLASMRDRPSPANSRPRVAVANAEWEFPLFDRAVFEDITNCLSAAELAEHVQTLITRCEVLSRKLNAPGMPDHARELVEEAHSLAGGAGTFGFLSLAAVARQFEVAAESGAPDIAAAADLLAIEINVSMPIISQQCHATTMVAV